MKPKIIQIVKADRDDCITLYGLDDQGNVWYLQYMSDGYFWTLMNAQFRGFEGVK